MQWEKAQWHIPLEEKPVILQIGVGIHGPRETKRYRFEGLWCVHLYGYSAEVRLDGKPFPVRPGYAGIIPPGVAADCHFPDLSRHNYAHFALPTMPDAPRVPILAMQDLGEDFTALNQSFEQALGYFSTMPRRAEVKLWDILWQLAERAPHSPMQSPKRHPAVQRTLQIIEMRLTEPLRVADLAHAVDLSHNHLTRLFRQEMGKTVIGYIQERRVQRAQHLLTYSTMPIKTVAAEVGIRDLHLFNKTIRRALGEAPRRIRERRDS